MGSMGGTKPDYMERSGILCMEWRDKIREVWDSMHIKII